MPDMVRIRREGMRWNLLKTLLWNRPYTMPEQRLVEVALTLYPDTTPQELRSELVYLEDRGLVKITRQANGAWFGDLTRDGVDVAEYTVDCEPGIARPPKFWAD